MIITSVDGIMSLKGMAAFVMVRVRDNQDLMKIVLSEYEIRTGVAHRNLFDKLAVN